MVVPSNRKETTMASVTWIELLTFGLLIIAIIELVRKKE